MKIRTSLGVGCVVLACLAGCQKQEDRSAGPAEQAGRKLDEAAAKIAPEVNKLGQKAGEAMQSAGQTLQQKAKEARDQPPPADQPKQ